MNGCFWPTWRWVNSFFDFCPIRHTFDTFFESPKKLKLPFFELETWFFVWRDVFDQLEHMSTHFLILVLLRSKMALWSWAVYNIKSALSKQKCLWLYLVISSLENWAGPWFIMYSFVIFLHHYSLPNWILKRYITSIM